MTITTQLHTSLQGEQAEALSQLVKAAEGDTFVSDGKNQVPKGENRTAILKDGVVVGFLSPYPFVLQTEMYQRAGPLYLAPEHRGQGIMREALRDFFKKHTPGLAWIDDTNEASIKLFVSLGFTRHSAWPAANGGEGHWYTQTESGAPRPSVEAWQDRVPPYLRW